MKQAIINATVHTGDEMITNSVVIIENDMILSVLKEVPHDIPTIDLKGKHIAAGFIDIQINGGEQFNFSQFPTQETIQDIHDSSLKYATTHTLPCLISASNESIHQGIEAIRNYREKYKNEVLGMHLEGLFFFLYNVVPIVLNKFESHQILN